MKCGEIPKRWYTLIHSASTIHLNGGGMHPLFEHRLRPIATVVLFFFTFYCIEPLNFAIAAQDAPKPQLSNSSKVKTAPERFEESLRAAKQVIDNLDQQIADGQDIAISLKTLKGHRQTLTETDQAIRAEFAETKAKLKTANLPDEILERHKKAVADYEANFQTLKDNLEAIEQLEGDQKKAEGKQDQKVAKATWDNLKKRVKEARTHLQEKVKERSHTPLDPNNLPHRTPKFKERKPRLKKEQFAELQQPIQLAFNGDPSTLLVAQSTQDLPKPGDLAETIEVQFTQEIKDLATQLEHKPVKIYNWVRNNIDFVPTYGSIQGANMCLMTKQCNDMDTASLLIALLRVSNIPARYVYGTIEVPIDKVMNWVGGFTDAKSALGFISSGGTPSGGVISGGKIVAARMEHAWVETYVPYGPYSGRPSKLNSPKTWIPLDGSFKQYTHTEGINLKAAVPFDTQAFLNQVQATATIDPVAPSVTGIDAAYVKTILTDYQNQIGAYLTNNFPQATVGDVMGAKTIKEKHLDILPLTLPYKKVVMGGQHSEVPDALRHKVTIALTTDEFFGPEFSFTASLPAFAGKRITLSYDPATAADQSLIDSYINQFATSIPAYLVHLQPKLKIDNKVVSSGASIGMGQDQPLTMNFTSPSSIGQEQVAHLILAGDYSAVGLNLGQVTADLLQRRIDLNDFSEPVGEMLHQTLLSYWGEVDAFNKITALQADVMTIRHSSEGLAIAKITPTYLFGVPNKASYKSRTLDIARDLQTVIHKAGDPQAAFSYFTQAGIQSSAMEGLIFDQLFGGNLGDGVSAVRILDLANAQGIPVFHIHAGNVGTVLPLLQVSQQVKSSIQDAINAGKIVQVPKREITHNGWTGVGYIVLDPANGTGAYLISGGLAGGNSNTGVSICVPLPEVPLSGAAGLVIRILSNSAKLDINTKELISGTFVAASIAIPIPSPDKAVVTAMGVLLIAMIIFGVLVDVADKIKIPPRYEIFRHYTTLQSKGDILASSTITASVAFGDLFLPGVYITDLMIEPINEANRKIIEDALGISFERTEAYVQIQIDRNRVFLFHFRPDFPRQYLYPFRDMRHDPPKIIFQGIP